ncbi:hypothetical protein PR202_gb05528 [Eleusine coracana subsp. coracana]|uniref:Uncharacterized protein n=1 Tax=Eleusine coracana subsp. coracana TaxID=191504 RepID=A0AAV5E4Q8_ELECO|nr:hypothetical protein PR202_gb05528 [Eleusine coracana subsp. coracana]
MISPRPLAPPRAGRRLAGRALFAASAVRLRPPSPRPSRSPLPRSTPSPHSSRGSSPRATSPPPAASSPPHSSSRARPPPLPLAAPLLEGLLSLRRARDAASVLRWLCRPDSPRRPDAATYATAVAGLCRLEDPKGALAALREMSADGIQASQELRKEVVGVMLQDARIEEVWALEDAMRRPETGSVVELVDKLLAEWEP